VYEFPIFIIISVALECGMGILFGIGVGYDPVLVYLASVTLNFLTVLAVIVLIDRLFRWKKGLGDWIKKRLGRGQKLIDKYGCLGIIMGVFILSPIQLAIVGRLLCMKPSKLIPSLLGAIILVAAIYLGIALGVFKFLL
jgi:hypothetical protein